MSGPSWVGPMLECLSSSLCSVVAHRYRWLLDRGSGSVLLCVLSLQQPFCSLGFRLGPENGHETAYTNRSTGLIFELDRLKLVPRPRLAVNRPISAKSGFENNVVARGPLITWQFRDRPQEPLCEWTRYRWLLDPVRVCVAVHIVT